MHPLQTLHVYCPYCGEGVELQVDVSGGAQHYVEDCPVCCQPMDVTVHVLDEHGGLSLSARRQDEA